MLSSRLACLAVVAAAANSIVVMAAMAITDDRLAIPVVYLGHHHGAELRYRELKLWAITQL